MNRRLVIAALVLAAAVGAGLYWRGRSRPAPSPAAAPTGRSATIDPARPLTSPSGPRSAEIPPTHLTLTRGSGATTPMGDNAVVHDHRTDREDPGTIGGGTEPVAMPSGIAPATTATVQAQLRPLITECAHDVPAAARGARPHASAALTVSVAGGMIDVESVDASVTDVSGDAGAAVSACMKSRMAGMQLPAAGEPDHAPFVLNLGFLIM